MKRGTSLIAAPLVAACASNSGAGLTKDEVLRLIGPPDYRRSAYFEARDELAWEWRIRQGYGDPAHFGVLFDATAGTVRSTLIVPEILGASCWP